MERKYTLVKTDTVKSWDGRTLYRIKAEKTFGDISQGELGGYVESENNLSSEGDA